MTVSSSPQARLFVINTFTLKPGASQDEFVTLMKETAGKAPPGCVNLQLHSSVDGRKVVNRSEWTSMEAFEKRFEAADGKAAFGKIMALVESVQQEPYWLTAEVQL
ncbi:hypothetical protein HDU86_001549 [Geranomyces michiganensis]|nr:hypothetical protein HDU86_001549 [Geranomyces michiganensis]